jgi:hypothetical protein
MFKNKKLLIAIVVVGLVIVGIIVAYVFRPEKECVCNVKSQAELSSSELVSRYETDEAQANNDFLGKVITVNGIISSAQKDEKGRAIVEIDGESIGMVSCTLCQKESNSTELTSGSTVRIKGQCVGYTIDVVLVKCCLE